MTREQKKQLMHENILKTEQERDAVIDTGCYNSYIKGYLIMALQELGRDASDIEDAAQALRIVLDAHRAQDARRISEIF